MTRPRTLALAAIAAVLLGGYLSGQTTQDEIRARTGAIRSLLDEIDALAVPPPPAPVDCVVSAWSLSSAGPWVPSTCPAEGQQTRTETWDRTVTIQPANGGAQCPVLSEARTGTQACVPPPPPPPPPSTVFSTTFDCPEWQQTSGTDPCPDESGVSRHGDWTMGGKGDEIVAAANRPGGGGGSGLRHWRGDGTNSGGGGVTIRIPAAASELWVRTYMRYQAGMSWGHPSGPNYTKDHYWGTCGSGCLIFGIQGNRSWGVNYNGTTNYPSSLTWLASMGGLAADGQWHAYEYHVKRAGASSVIEFWFDGVRYLNQTANLGTGTWQSFALGENQAIVAGCPSGCATDYDDVAISITGPVGP